jgi:hypothetical protein
MELVGFVVTRSWTVSTTLSETLATCTAPNITLWHYPYTTKMH